MNIKIKINKRKEDFIMEEFLKDYVQMMAEVNGVNIDDTQLQEIVNNLMDCEVIWDVLDEHINYEFDEMEVR